MRLSAVWIARAWQTLVDPPTETSKACVGQDLGSGVF
jgi:hypothetical protein